MANENDEMIVKIADELKLINASLKRLNSIGFNQELIIIYIHDKTKLGKSKVREVLKSQTDFFSNFDRKEQKK